MLKSGKVDGLGGGGEAVEGGFEFFSLNGDGAHVGDNAAGGGVGEDGGGLGGGFGREVRLLASERRQGGGEGGDDGVTSSRHIEDFTGEGRESMVDPAGAAERHPVGPKGDNQLVRGEAFVDPFADLFDGVRGVGMGGRKIG